MTIIEPHKSKYSYSSIVLVMMLLLAVFACLNIYFYNQTVNLKHSISAATKNLQELQVSNAELRNQLYKITDLSSLDSIAKSKGLVKDAKPQYLETGQNSLAIN